jgi:hypothetical protein
MTDKITYQPQVLVHAGTELAEWKDSGPAYDDILEANLYFKHWYAEPYLKEKLDRTIVGLRTLASDGAIYGAWRSVL